VEVRDGQILTCGHVDLPAALADLAAAGVTLVPVTARSRAQLDALTPLAASRLAITAAGGGIWRGPQPLPGWSAVLRRHLAGTASVHQARRRLAAQLRPAPWIIGEQLVDGYFFYLLAGHGQLPDDAEPQARAVLAACGWTAYAHGRKLYCLPTPLRKHTALGWLVDRLGDRLIAVAGDSEMDLDLLSMAPAAFYPAASSLAASSLRPPHARVTVASHAAAGPEILRAVADLAREPAHSLIHRLRRTGDNPAPRRPRWSSDTERDTNRSLLLRYAQAPRPS
jgi:hypothetical protein